MKISNKDLDKISCIKRRRYSSSEPMKLRIQEMTTRNGIYEELAEMLVFPCSNRRYGCSRNISFLQQKNHEMKCRFRPYSCPINSSTGCKWKGPFQTIIDHCRREHPDNIIGNRCFIRQSLSEDGISTYVIPDTEQVFVIYAKVCLASRLVYHSVQKIGKDDPNVEFKYDLETSVGTLEGIVHTADDFCFQEAGSPVTSIDELVKQFGGNEEAEFRVTIKKYLREVRCQRCEESRNNFISFCDECSPPTRTCRYYDLGCDYSDMHIKTLKHELYTCPYSSPCFVCLRNIEGSLEEHRIVYHPDVTCTVNHPFPFPEHVSEKSYIIGSDFAQFYCTYVVQPAGSYELRVFSTLSSVELAQYECVLEFSNSKSQCSVKTKANDNYVETFDWFATIEKDDVLFIMGNPDCLAINISRKQCNVEFSDNDKC